MIVRKFEKLGVETSLLGFGCMRLPLDANGAIDEAETQKMFDLAYRAGVNYFDTAYGYHGGESERVTGRMLKRYPRDSFFVATKLPMYMIESLEQAKAIFEEQLEKLQMDHFDFYMLHSMNGRTFDLAVRLGIIEYCEQLKREGKIRFFGFSFHDGYDQFERMLNYRDWDFCQIQYNYRDEEEQAGTRGYRLAAERGIPMIVMEPVKGGVLANLMENVDEPFRKVTPGASNASFALRWVADHENVKVILSGMSTPEQMEDNLNTFAKPWPLTEAEREAIAEVARRLDSRVKIGCTGCRYCMPCPAGVNIPANFEAWNGFGMYGEGPNLDYRWKVAMPDSARANRCVQCHQCEAKCPQHLPIAQALQTLQKELDAACDR
ncbi:MAG TPA: aldo/keto reductase [Candidatus Limiplasma sp.]|nr:aldo/keto reductase [Candidatus Limiplasma sp.]HPS81657.1 aldo/keto reductase [Candidatus Limiplasma sp.]